MAEDAGLDVVGQAHDAPGAVDLVQRLTPDLLLLDISMPGGGGLGALRQVMALPAPPKVAMLTASEEDDEVMQALKAGALGYVLKGVGARDLVGIVKDLARGQSYVTPVLAARLLAVMRDGGKAARAAESSGRSVKARGRYSAAGGRGAQQQGNRSGAGVAGKDGQALHDLDPAKAASAQPGGGGGAGAHASAATLGQHVAQAGGIGAGQRAAGHKIAARIEQAIVIGGEFLAPAGTVGDGDHASDLDDLGKTGAAQACSIAAAGLTAFDQAAAPVAALIEALS